MKKLFALILIVLLASACVFAQSVHEVTHGEYEGKAVILHTNDVHGAIEGYAKLAALKADFESKGAEVILVDGGDFSQGTKYVSISKGLSAVQIMNLVGYDVAVIGNHEFDYGYPQLVDNMKQASFAVLCSDIYDENGIPLFSDYFIYTTSQGARIGFFGIDTPESQTKVNPTLIKGLGFVFGEELYAVAQKDVDELRSEGVDTVICIGHLGVDPAAVPNRSVDLLANVEGIDFLIDGHSHTVFTEYNEFENIQQTGTAFANIGIIILDGATGAIEEHYLLPCDELAEDPDVLDVTQSIIDEVQSVYGVKFAESKVDLNGEKAPGNRTMETNSGDLVSDAMLWCILSNPDSLTVAKENVVAVSNGGGIRAWIHSGDITKQDVNTMLPFGSIITVIYVKGSELLEALEASTFSTPGAVGGFPQIGGMKITIDTTKEYKPKDEPYPSSTYYGPASIERVTINDINGQPFDPEETYAVVTLDFCAVGGDTYYAFVNASSQFSTGFALDDVVIDYITEVLGGVICEDYAEPQGRITIIQ